VQQIVDALEANHASAVRVYGGTSALTEATVLPEAAPLPAARDLDTPSPLDEPVPSDGLSGDVVAVEEGGPDVRGPDAAASRDALAPLPDEMSEWRSGGDAVRPPASDSDLDLAAPASRDLDGQA